MKNIITIVVLALALSLGAAAQTAVPETADGAACQEQVQPTSPLARIVFTHKSNSKFDRTMNLARLQSMYRFMPRKLKREIGQVYYPALREDLHMADTTSFMEAEASKEMLADGTMLIKLSFPKFFLDMEHITWEDLDGLFLTYFQEK